MLFSIFSELRCKLYSYYDYYFLTVIFLTVHDYNVDFRTADSCASTRKSDCLTDVLADSK